MFTDVGHLNSDGSHCVVVKPFDLCGCVNKDTGWQKQPQPECQKNKEWILAMEKLGEADANHRNTLTLKL